MPLVMFFLEKIDQCNRQRGAGDPGQHSADDQGRVADED
jgi:hypothetical protein